MFPWEVDSSTINKPYIGPHLFSALYRVYRGAYYGQGFNFCGKPVQLPPNFQTYFDNLPIDIKGIILSKVWNQGLDYNTLLIASGKIYLEHKLHFLFSQYGRLKNITQLKYSKGTGVWNGYIMRENVYKFIYGPKLATGKYLIPNFVNSETTTKGCSLLCP